MTPRPAGPQPGPRIYALLGDPVAHSRSPRIHNAAFAACGLAAEYRTMRVDAPHLASRLRALAEAGGGGNVTVPHKELAAGCIDHPADAVRRTGAVNTFWGGPDGVHGENTDVAGFRAAAAHHGVSLSGRRALLLGAGGAAAAVLLALVGGQTRVTIVNRSADRARALAARIGGQGLVTWAGEPAAEPFDLVINATSLGMHQADPMPLPIERLPAHATVLDLVYAADGTRWVSAARAAGFQAFDGTEMLLRQAAAAFTLWTRLPAPVDVMRKALADTG